MDGGAWWAAVYGVAQSQTWLKWLSSSSSSRSRVDSICKGLGAGMIGNRDSSWLLWVPGSLAPFLHRVIKTNDVKTDLLILYIKTCYLGLKFSFPSAPKRNVNMFRGRLKSHGLSAACSLCLREKSALPDFRWACWFCFSEAELSCLTSSHTTVGFQY